MSTHNLCFEEKNYSPCVPHFYYIKVGYKGVDNTRTSYIMMKSSCFCYWHIGNYMHCTYIQISPDIPIARKLRISFQTNPPSSPDRKPSFQGGSEEAQVNGRNFQKAEKSCVNHV